MKITGHLYYDGAWHAGEGGSYEASNPATAEALEPAMSMASPAQVDAAVAAAHRAFLAFRQTSVPARAAFLRRCADEIMALGDALLERVSAETAYPRGRAENERARTCGQLRMFADYLESGGHFDARIDTPQPQRQPLPKPDLRYLNQALGPVVVFGASNFPLAFSVAGGDTAAALAAGCPVLVKGHSSHPGTSELIAHALANAAEACAMPAGVFSLLMGGGSEVGARLVQAPQVKAVGFTGSFAGGMALFKLAAERPEPIPVFAEMGSVNPVFLLPEALQQSAEALAQGFVASLTLGNGQFCVNPGLVFAVEGEGLDRFIAGASHALSDIAAGAMLNERICTTYCTSLESYLAVDGVEVVARGQAVGDALGHRTQACLLRTTADNFLARREIHEEIFGPVSLLVVCKNREQMLQVASHLVGQLSGTIHCADGELADYSQLVDILTLKVGRLVINGFPTGVEVCPSMVHGGPFPASTDARFTSVGTAAIYRFLRPVCYQNFPEALLPDALKNANPLKLTRVVNGVPTDAAITPQH